MDTKQKRDGNGSQNGLALFFMERKRQFLLRLQDEVYKEKLIYTVSLCCAFAVLGFNIGQKGPTFLDLQIITNTDTEKASTFFTVGKVGFLVGALASGSLFDRYNKVLLLSISILVMGVLVGLIPICSRYYLMMTVFFLRDMFMAAFDIGANTEIIRVWGTEGKSFMQGLHFSFSCGAIISPLVTEPFLAIESLNSTLTTNLNNASSSFNSADEHSIQNEPTSAGYRLLNQPETFNITSSNQTINDSNLDEYFSLGENNRATYKVFNKSGLSFFDFVNVTADDDFSDISKPITQVHYAFEIAAILTVLSSIPFLIRFCKVRTDVQETEERSKREAKRNRPLPVFVVLLILISLFYLVYAALEDSFSTYLVTFAVQHLSWTKSRSSQLASAFWAAGAVSRFIGIFSVHFVKPIIQFIVCSVILLLSFVGLCLSSVYFLNIGVWFFSVTVGLAMSVLFPTSLSCIEEDVVKLSGKLASLIFISASVGCMLNPLVLGYLIQDVAPIWFCFFLFSESVFSMIVFATILAFTKFVFRERVNDNERAITTEKPEMETESMI